MVPNLELIQYACIARSTTILAHRRASSADPNIETLASQCIADAPPNHSLYSHTVNHRTYMFLIDPPFLFFAIFDHHLLKPLQLRFLHRLRSNSRSFLDSHSNSADDNDLAPLCFQSEFDSIFYSTLDFNSGSNDAVSRNPSTDSKGKRSMSTAPLLPKPAAEGMLLKKKKRAVECNGGFDGKDGGGTLENKVEVCGGGDEVNGCGGGRDFSVAVTKSGAFNDRHQKAKHIWKKHVWVVLLLDLFVCAVLFVIWLWVCSGFKCMAY